jgi:hypothetical protein
MTDKLQDSVERWIEQNERIAEDMGSEYAIVFVDDLRAFLAQYVLCEKGPFGYFKAEPFGWTDCAETDEGAMALYTPAKGVE